MRVVEEQWSVPLANQHAAVPEFYVGIENMNANYLIKFILLIFEYILIISGNFETVI